MLFRSVDAALDMESGSTFDESGLVQSYYNYGEYCYLYYPNSFNHPNYSFGTKWDNETQFVFVGETGYQSFFVTDAKRCRGCNGILHEEAPYVYAVENIVVEDPSIVELVNVSKTGVPVSLEADSYGYPELHVNFKGLKAGTTTISYDLDYEFYYSGATGSCNFCGAGNTWSRVDKVYSGTIKFNVTVEGSEDLTAPEAPERTDLPGILGNFVKVVCTSDPVDPGTGTTKHTKNEEKLYSTWGNNNLGGKYESKVG